MDFRDVTYLGKGSAESMDGFSVLSSNKLVYKGWFNENRCCKFAQSQECFENNQKLSIGYRDSTGLLHGRGKQQDHNGTISLGTFNHGALEGLGLVYNTYHQTYYFGELKSGAYHGAGYLTMGNFKYYGQFKNGTYHGLAMCYQNELNHDGVSVFNDGKLICTGGIFEEEVDKLFSFTHTDADQFSSSLESEMAILLTEIEQHEEVLRSDHIELGVSETDEEPLHIDILTRYDNSSDTTHTANSKELNLLSNLISDKNISQNQSNVLDYDKYSSIDEQKIIIEESAIKLDLEQDINQLDDPTDIESIVNTPIPITPIEPTFSKHFSGESSYTMLYSMILIEPAFSVHYSEEDYQIIYIQLILIEPIFVINRYEVFLKKAEIEQNNTHELNLCHDNVVIKEESSEHQNCFLNESLELEKVEVSQGDVEGIDSSGVAIISPIIGLDSYKKEVDIYSIPNNVQESDLSLPTPSELLKKFPSIVSHSAPSILSQNPCEQFLDSELIIGLLLSSPIEKDSKTAVPRPSRAPLSNHRNRPQKKQKRLEIGDLSAAERKPWKEERRLLKPGNGRKNRKIMIEKLVFKIHQDMPYGARSYRNSKKEGEDEKKSINLIIEPHWKRRGIRKGFSWNKTK